jgi:outer membrane protein assembly factor BamE (lipoprotein component of BamABCDE complex)
MIYKKNFHSFLSSALLVMVTLALASMNTSAQKGLTKGRLDPAPQPAFSDYKAVRLGMSAEEVHAKLGKPELAADDQDYYIVSATETAQIVYDAAHKATTISIDFLQGIGAPDYKTVVGPDLQSRPDGSLYKIVFYENLGFWVSYNRSVGTVPMVTITLQKIK